MKMNDTLKQSRRRFLQTAGAAAASLALGGLPLAARAAGEAAGKMKIGVIGSGRVGGTVGELWVKAGHEVMFSSLDLEHDKALAARLGAGARAGTSKEAAVFGEVLFIAVPYAALPQVGRDLGDALNNKIVLDACNPIPGRDGEMAIEARAKGTGIASPQFLPGARAGTSKEAAVFGEVLFIAVPYAALPQVGRDLGDALNNKIVLDACNPIPGRDGEMAIEARAKGTGIA